MIACCLGTGTLAQDEIPLRMTVSEGTSSLACRIHLKDSANKPVRPPNLPFWNDHFVCNGEANLRLPRGDYSYEIERGPEYSAAAGKVSLTEPQSVTNRLARIVDMTREGWWSGETHVHRPIADVELLMRAEDLHVAPVITWWNEQNLWAKQTAPENLLVQFDGDRFYQVMGGEDERAGGALLYFNLSEPLKITGAKYEYPSPMKFLSEARRHPGVWVDIEKPFWYDVPVWLASGMMDSIGIANNHMYRTGVYRDEAWGRVRDKERLPDPQGNGFWTQEIYYHALNCGLRIPPSAGSASGVLPNPVGYNRVYVHLYGPLTWSKWWDSLRAGHLFVSNGPLLRCKANGEFPGQVFKVPKGETIKINLEAALDSRDAISAVEIVRNGKVERSIPVAELKPKGSLGEISFAESGWFLVRAMADVPNTFRFASTGPFYVESAAPRISKASAQFFLDWVRERMDRVKLDSGPEREEVLKYHHNAERFWKEKVTQANAD